MNLIEQEIELAHLLARINKKRIAVVQCGSLVLALLPEDIEPGSIVLYVTI